MKDEFKTIREFFDEQGTTMLFGPAGKISDSRADARKALDTIERRLRETDTIIRTAFFVEDGDETAFDSMILRRGTDEAYTFREQIARYLKEKP